MQGYLGYVAYLMPVTIRILAVRMRRRFSWWPRGGHVVSKAHHTELQDEGAERKLTSYISADETAQLR